MTDLNRRTSATEPKAELAPGQPLPRGAGARHALGRALPGGRGGRAVALAVAVILPLTLANTSMAATQVSVTNPGGLTAAGPVNAEYGFPSWYSDSSGTRLEPCLDGANPLCGFLPGDIPNPDIPVSFPGNFPGEFFYQVVSGDLALPGGGRAVLTLGLEAAFAQGAAAAGDQQVFARTRVVVKGGTPNTTLTFKHPFGELTIDTDTTGAGRLVQDISPSVGNFSTPLASNFGPFLKWDPAVAPLAPAGYVGDPGVAHQVVGGKNGYNAFSVTGGGLNLSTTDLTISGKIATNTGVTGDYAVVNGQFLDVFATSRGTSLQVDGVNGAYLTTPMEQDAGSERHYARIALLNGATPAKVTVSNLGDKPVSTAVITVADVKVSQADYDGTSLTVTASATTYPLTVVGVGTLANGLAKAFPLSAPPAAVTVRSATGSPVTVPVRITSGPVSDPALAPVTPAPAGPPVNDNTANNPAIANAAPVATVAAVPAAIGGATVTLDGSASSGASAYAWSQVGGPVVALTGQATAKPTFTVPFFTATSAAKPATAASPLSFRLVVTNAAGVSSAPTTVVAPIKADTLAVTVARHRLGDELRVDGTSLIDGVAGARTPSTAVVIWDNSKPSTPVKIGTAIVDSLGAWSLRLRPGPGIQVTAVLVQSTRGGVAALQTTR